MNVLVRVPDFDEWVRVEYASGVEYALQPYARGPFLSVRIVENRLCRKPYAWMLNDIVGMERHETPEGAYRGLIEALGSLFVQVFEVVDIQSEAMSFVRKRHVAEHRVPLWRKVCRAAQMFVRGG